MKFTKMHGAGNDYVYVNCFEETLPKSAAELAIEMSHRHFGVGADGLILIGPSDCADAKMTMYNADGSEAEMCGNGLRCVAKFVYDHAIAQKQELALETGAGVLNVTVSVNNGLVDQVTVDMGEPGLASQQIPTTIGSHDDQVVGSAQSFDGVDLDVTTVSMGNPHCIAFVDEANDDLVLQLGPKIETDARFPERTNVEFVEVLSRSHLRQRTWERGSGETWACGTGASAVCVAGVLTGVAEREVAIDLLGGTLHLRWDEESNHVFMTGPAEEVFTGQWPVA